MNELQRSLMTISCRDTDAIPKVANAGAFIQQGDDLVQVMHNGLHVEAGGYFGDWMAHVIRGLQGHHEPQEELIFYYLLRYVRNNSLVIELGCYWAYYALWFLKAIPNSRALCIEPDFKHLAVGMNNARLNEMSDRIHFVNAWIGGTSADEYVSSTESCSSPVAIPMMDMSSIELMIGDKHAELIHLDIQGAELPFLQSMCDFVRRKKVRFLMVSTHHSSISGSMTTHSDCLEQLRFMGATILVEHNVIESYSGDGMILASFYQEDKALWFPTISRNQAETSLFKSF
jgi:FkbM family methyltransferase